MCLVAIAFQTIPNCPVLIFANREEAANRPSTSPKIHSPMDLGSLWFGGIDLKAGGTWLGVSQSKFLVAVTNRPKTKVPTRLKSRGLLCRALLEQPSFEAAEAEFHRQWSHEAFAGFNLILISAERGIVFSAADELQVQSLTPGQHAITNCDWNDPMDLRIGRVHRLMDAFGQDNPSIEEWIEFAKKVCGLGEESGQDAVCLPCTRGFGTVSSSIIALTSELKDAQYLHSAGSPDVTAYKNVSPQFRNLWRPSP